MTGKERADAYALITDKIISALEDGVVPWRKPWRAIDAPRSLSSGKPYRGINTVVLSLTQQLEGYGSPYWGTYAQIKKHGGQVRKGEKSTAVVLYKRVTVKDRDSEDGERKEISLLRHFYVFNADQADGLELETLEERDHVPMETAESIVTGYRDGPSISHGGDRAAYSPALDQVMMPRPESFESGERYYATLFHELIHSTGHESRLDRVFGDSFGDHLYSKEELIAEIGACFLMSESGLELELEQPAAYVASWLAALRDDKKLIIAAAAGAQKAADRVRGETYQAEESRDPERVAVAA